MATLLCKCGEGMYTSDDPSPYIVNIFYKEEVDHALRDNPDISLHDFLTGWDEKNGCDRIYMDRTEPVDYWFCPTCKRVYEVQYIPGGRWLRMYRKSDRQEPKCLDKWRSIYVMKDTDTYLAMEEEWEIHLFDYIERHNAVSYYLSQDETMVCAIEKGTNKRLYSYVLEEDFTPSDSQ